ncbi:ABC transporter ATP-binding protein [Estrella lausannensis]|uniref:Lipoprotein-releasing system ATP-binding protein LolD n=1 Tax=Estrella lausannensis TaxID=483423 RepID=A0A0H5DPU0_9BACT|nr:ABC transporter ATP-binding protein [Estrella lausannensis]CRX38497.1 Lipoprotein-releasing system ATP-binding protein LolD [Estrella lausannensis]
MSIQTPLLKACEIHKTFAKPRRLEVLKGINLEVYPGETIAIVGKSGEGKSTLLNILGTLEKPTSGSLFIDDEAVSLMNVSRIRGQKLGFVFQSFHLLEDYTVMENILFPAAIARVATGRGTDAYKRAEELLELVGLTERKDYSAKLLSGGEKQRVAIARAFLNNPSIILADEPTGNLDEETSAAIHRMLFNFAAQGKACIIVTHSTKLANECSRTITLKGGSLAADSMQITEIDRIQIR